MKVQLNGPPADILVLACILIKGIGTGHYQVFQGPFAGSVPEAVIYSFIAEKGVFIDRHGKIFSQKYEIYLSAQKHCVHPFLLSGHFVVTRRPKATAFRIAAWASISAFSFLRKAVLFSFIAT